MNGRTEEQMNLKTEKPKNGKTEELKDRKLVSEKDYVGLLKEIKEKIVSARIKAFRGINKELIKLYWEIGRLVVERQQRHKWGKSVVEKLSKDLRGSFNVINGYSAQNLWYMRQFYLEYKEEQKLQQLVGEIPWGHNILIISRVKDKKAREYYLRASAESGWSRNVLLNQIKAGAYQGLRN
ncbi:MAG: DUF1016 N-terminal domain-containing protein [Dehalococcoidia bacterium]